jgi:hypothetical protein
LCTVREEIENVEDMSRVRLERSITRVTSEVAVGEAKLSRNNRTEDVIKTSIVKQIEIEDSSSLYRTHLEDVMHLGC